MNIKKFLILSVFAISSVAAYACVAEQVVRYYIYYLPENNRSWEERKREGIANAWSSLLGVKVTEEDVWRLSWIDDSDDWSTISNKIVKTCMDGRHNAELEYLKTLVKFMEEGRLSYNDWDYPSKEEIANRDRILKSIRDKAYSRSGGRLGPQYRLLNMRCSFSLGKWQDVIDQWEAVPKDDSIFTEMMRNLYAGALYRTGRIDEAYAIYSEQGDNCSALWCVAKSPLVTGLESFYNSDPNSPVLPLLIKQFCNNTQETVDVLDDIAKQKRGMDYMKEYLGGIGAREINRTNAAKFIDFAKRAAANPQVKDAAMWLNAAALVNYYYGDAGAAKELLEQAKISRKTQTSQLGTKYIAIFVDLAFATDNATKSRLALQAVNWLKSQMPADGTTDESFPGRMLTRLVNCVLQPEFSKSGMYNELLAATAALCNRGEPVNLNNSNFLYSDMYFNTLDTIPLPRLIKWSKYIDTVNPSDGWNVLARRHCSGEMDFLNDIIGTRFLRQGKTAEAKTYLSAVSLSFLSRQNIAPYAAARKFTDIPWLTRCEPVNTERKVQFTRNPKIAYCNYLAEVRRRAAKTGSSNDLVRLAAAYFNASERGKCWWLTKYKSSVYPDSVKAPDFDYALQCNKLLERAKTAVGTVKNIEILFAQAFIAPEDIYYYDAEYNQRVNPESQYIRAYGNLAAAYINQRGTVPVYISRCDVLRQFINNS